MSQLPAYYDILHVSPNATTEEIRTAYKKESLKTHPDRSPNVTPEQRRVLTEKFQTVADAYYVLSDPKRRREYDSLLRSRGGYKAHASAGPNASPNAQPAAGGASTDPAASAAFFEQFKRYFTNAAAGAGASNAGASGAGAHKSEESDIEEELNEEVPLESDAWNAGNRPNADHVFSDVFEELLRPEVHRAVNWWTYIGAVSGASLGFILANVPGALAGGLAGNRLGAIRDAKGKPVVEVFTQLGGSEKAEILKILAIKVFGSLTSI